MSATLAEQQQYLREWDESLRAKEAALAKERGEFDWCRRGVEAQEISAGMRPSRAVPCRELYEDAT